MSILCRPLKKHLEACKVGSWKFSHLKFSIFFGQDPTIKKEEGWRWHERICFQPLPPPLPHHPKEVLQQEQTPLIFQTDYIDKGVEESYFTRQGGMVSVDIPRLFRKCYICQAADGFDQQRG